ncbi:hypothetical protein ACI3QN_12795, partial [Propionibacterium freudenreichii]|uniref:hypothetical protein n=1 Tax=Propionibacterium freudenreichii TaxID=1744 RepID=UPI003853406A
MMELHEAPVGHEGWAVLPGYAADMSGLLASTDHWSRKVFPATIVKPPHKGDWALKVSVCGSVWDVEANQEFFLDKADAELAC